MDDLVPDRIGEVIGWRAWEVKGDMRYPLLCSVSRTECVWHADHWTLGTCGGDLTCKHSQGWSLDVDVPGVQCTCGLYAAASREQLVTLRYAKERAGGRPRFIGEVAFAGKVIPGTQGWRAQKGRIARLYVPFHWWRYVDPLERLYDVECVVENTTKVPTKEVD